MRNFRLFWVLVIMLLAVGCKRPAAIDFPSLLVDRFSLVGNRGEVSSTQKLLAGHLYSVVVFGTIHFAQDDRAVLDAQHKFSFKSGTYEDHLSLFIDNEAVSAAVTKKDPEAYIFYWVGRGSPNSSQAVHFRIDDDQVDDNSGELEIRIYNGYLTTFPPDLPPKELHRNPNMVKVDANKSWQGTGLRFNPGDHFRIISVTGVITDSNQPIHGGNGRKSICSQPGGCCGPLTESPQSALIARIGETFPFFIGNGDPNQDIPVSVAGELELGINDCENGLMDNQGILNVEILPKPQ